MGNCTSGKRKKKKGDCGADDTQPNEEVTYASIDHSNAKTTTTRATADEDCDYATVNVPRGPIREVESDCNYATVNVPRETIREVESDCNYATVNVPRETIREVESDCDHATVNVPGEPIREVESDCEGDDCKEDCADDYVSMS